MKFGWKGGLTKNPEETMDLGKEFSKYLEPGDVFAFEGELASGKTTFVKGVLDGLNFNKPVTSPTFTLVNEYNAKFPIIHIDCYREEEIERWVHLGMNDYLCEENVVIIEWAEKIISLLPQNTFKLNFTHQGLNQREIILIN